MSAGCEVCKGVYDTYSYFVSYFGCLKDFNLKCVKLKARTGDEMELSGAVSTAALAKSEESAVKIKAATEILLEMISSHSAGLFL